MWTVKFKLIFFSAKTDAELRKTRENRSKGIFFILGLYVFGYKSLVFLSIFSRLCTNERGNVSISLIKETNGIIK